MKEPKFLNSKSGREIAYHRSPGKGPGVVFLGGFKSDMEGTKAIHLEEWAKSEGRAFVRFDYSGHGSSSEKFEDGSIGDWADDAAEILTHVADGPQVLVGSSMGGWISTLLINRIPDRVAGFVGIAAAPDFTEDSMWAGFDPDQRQELADKGHIYLPSDYGEPYLITQKLIENGRDNLVLRQKIKAPFPVRLLQGTADNAVETSVALRLLENLDCDDARLTLVKNADHSFSDDRCLPLIVAAIEDVLAHA